MVKDAKGTFRPKVIEAYLAADLDPSSHPSSAEEAKIYEAEDVRYYRPPKEKSTPSSSTAMGSCLYMDVGMWAGDGPAGSLEHYPRRRQFGIVAGNIAALCHYPKPKINPGEARWSKLPERVPEVFLRRIELLLDALSQSEQLGAVEVTKVLVCWDLARARISPEGLSPEKHTTTYIFLGDMHLPVMTRLQRTFLLPDNEARRYIPRLSMPRPSVSSCGRLPVKGEAKALARQLKSIILKKTGWIYLPAASIYLTYLVELLEKFYLACPPLTEFYPPGEAPRQPPYVIPSKEAVDWFNFYHGVYTGSGGRLLKYRAADIFEHAGEDLKAWITLLEGYEPTESRLKLVQLGDMYDLWIGFMSGLQKGRSAVPAARPFADFWRKESKTTTGEFASEQAEAAAALEEINSPFLSAVFLAGNHDNYLLDKELRPSAFESARPDSVIAEHGHASDSFNSDDDPTRGWALTQLAFLEPEVRQLEGLVGVLVAKTFRSMGARLTRIARGADLCYENDRLVYVMGHTHQPMLKKIHFYPPYGS